MAHGVSTCHSSNEYESFPLFCRVLERLRNSGHSNDRQHIVKLADPHFGETTFDPHRVRQRIESYLEALNVERIDVVQWMWRGDLKQEQVRLEGLAERSSLIEDTFSGLRQAGKVGTCVVFPYTPGFAESALGRAWCGGLAIYLNYLESEYLELARKAAIGGSSVIALRPLAARRVLDVGFTAASSIQWTLEQPAVATAVVSYSSEQHLKDLVSI